LILDCYCLEINKSRINNRNTLQKFYQIVYLSNYMDSFTMEVISAIKQIPSGKVSSYGRIARIAGNSRGARQVSRILHTLSKKHNLPWHRVISSTGKIVIQDEQNAILQKELLLNEGVQVSPQNTVDMKIYAIY